MRKWNSEGNTCTMSSTMNETDAVISDTVAALAAAQRTSFTKVLVDCGIPLATTSRRKKVGHWSAAEVQRVATRLGVSVGDLYTAMNGTLRFDRPDHPITRTHKGDKTHEYLRRPGLTDAVDSGGIAARLSKLTQQVGNLVNVVHVPALQLTTR